MNWFKKLKDGLSKSSKKVSESLASLPSLSALIGKSKLDAASLEEVEDALIAADLDQQQSARLRLLPMKPHPVWICQSVPIKRVGWQVIR